MRYRVHRVQEQDWRRLRDLRLAALRDTPLGFLENYADAARQDEASWRTRARRGSEEPDSCTFFAEVDGVDVGMMGGYVDAPGRVTVVAVFVRPEHRGRAGDVVGLLLDAVAGWARTREGVSQLRLEVHEDNTRALAAYRRLGFATTGATAPYPLPPGGRELEMTLPLRLSRTAGSAGSTGTEVASQP